MQVRHGEPTLGFVEKHEPSIEQDFIANECRVRA
jgi:hypothetical protein